MNKRKTGQAIDLASIYIRNLPLGTPYMLVARDDEEVTLDIAAPHTVAYWKVARLLGLTPSHTDEEMVKNLPGLTVTAYLESPLAIPVPVDTCLHGHAMTEANTLLKPNSKNYSARTCRQCDRDGQRRRYWRLRHGKDSV